MNSGTLRLLGVIVALLAAWLIIVEMNGDKGADQNGNLLFPGLRATINEIGTLSVTRSGENTVVVSNATGQWVVAARDGYPADIGRIRDVLLAMADARVVEAKTADPALHGRLGISSPDVAGSKGILVVAATDDVSFALVFGNASQGNYRYARKADEDQSWLIDQNPDIPSSPGEWLDPDIIDIDSSRVKTLTISHPDGEIIRIRKESEADSSFEVADVPEGRELSYSTVANGMGGALNDLDLDDVRRESQEENDAVTAEFETFDGLTVTVRTVKTDDASWITLNATATGDAEDEAAEINGRLAGWQYGIAEYKANLLTRRWDDILKAETE